MPDIKIAQVLSFSSEDASFPASNLLGVESYKKWRTKAVGEKEAVIMLKFDNSSKIEAVHIGNECSAFVEVFVGKLGADVKDFKVLLPTSSFMSPVESRGGTNTNRVRLFERDRLTDAANEPWEVVRVICTQPFCRTVQYGLAFIKFRTKSASLASSARAAENGAGEPLKLGAFTLRPEAKTNPIRAGELFNRRMELTTGASSSSDRVVPPRAPASSVQPTPPKPTAHYQLKPDTKQKPAPKPEQKPAPKPAQKPSANQGDRADKPQANKPVTPNRTGPTQGASKPSNLSGPPAPSGNQTVTPSTPSGGRAASSAAASDDAPPPNAIYRPLNKLLAGVVFAMSGYQNPERAELRDKGVKLGAKYRPDWGSGCTHLICAFKNTPKYTQVVGRGKIVTGDWLTACVRRKRRINWRIYALDSAEARREASGDEFWAEELRPAPKAGAPPAPSADDDEYGGSTDEMDTDDEIRMAEAAMKPSTSGATADRPSTSTKPPSPPAFSSAPSTSRQQDHPSSDRATSRKRSASPPSTSKSPAKRRSLNTFAKNGAAGGDDSDAAYDADTDEEEREAGGVEECRPDTSGLSVPELPDFLKGKKFLLYGEVMSGEDRRQAARYITAFGGKLEQYFGEGINYVITADPWDNNFDEALSDNPEIMFARPAWLEACVRRGKLVPAQAYLVTAIL